MNNLVYLSYGQGPHVDELVFSLLSAFHMIGPDRTDYRIIVYTDNPAALSGLPVQLELLSERVLADWAGPFDFNHRRKIFAIKDAVQKFGGRLLYCDADTYFIKHPRRIFARIRPGQTVMHIREGHLAYCHGSDVAAFLENHNLRTTAGRRWNITPHTLMFNAGIVGLDEADICLLDEVVHLTDQIYTHVRLHMIEQFAFSACFAEHTRLRESYDIIYHYWPMPRRVVFREQLRRVLHDPSIALNEERYQRLLPHQPTQSQRILNRGSESLKDRAHIALWELAKRTGVLDPLKSFFSRTGIS